MSLGMVWLLGCDETEEMEVASCSALDIIGSLDFWGVNEVLVDCGDLREDLGNWFADLSARLGCRV